MTHTIQMSDSTETEDDDNNIYAILLNKSKDHDFRHF